MLQIAQGVIEAEAIQAEEEKNRYMDENVPSLSVPGSMQELQVWKAVVVDQPMESYWVCRFLLQPHYNTTDSANHGPDDQLTYSIRGVKVRVEQNQAGL